MERRDKSKSADEKTSLSEFLDYQRATVLWKAQGIGSTDAARASVGTTDLTLAGVIKHLAYVEDYWFQQQFLGLDPPEPWASAPFDEDLDWEFHSAVDDDIEDLGVLYEASCQRSRAALAGASLGDTSVGRSRSGEPFSMRWIMLHMIEETARHAGHADLLREAIDGQIGE